MYIWWSQRYKKKSEWKQNDNKKMQKNKLEEIQKEIFQVFHTNERFRFGLMLGSFFFWWEPPISGLPNTWKNRLHSFKKSHLDLW
jgi:hypothetical protein